MRRILLLLEDYNELSFLQTLLKKLGFDAEPVRSELSLEERLLGLKPDLVIATGDGNKIKGDRVAKKVKKKGSTCRLLLLFPRAKISDEKYIKGFAADGVLESHLNPRQTLTTICNLTGLNPDTVLAKFDKLAISKEGVNNEAMHIVTGKKQKDSARVAKYREYLKDLPESPHNGFPHEKIQDEITKIRKQTVNQKLDDQRKAFVRALFKKSGG